MWTVYILFLSCGSVWNGWKSYALGELVTRDERISTVRQLWSLTGDLLVLIEPGTPEGSSLVREMRTHILQMEKKVQPLAVLESSLVL
jgi:hypothetical protein